MLLNFTNIRKYYKVRGRRVVRAVDGVSLSVKEGENLGLVGESGCGKTTLARIAVKLVPADTGGIRFQGRDVASWTQRRFRSVRKDMQIVFQDPYSSLDPRWTVRKILKEGMRLDKARFGPGFDIEGYLAGCLESVKLKPDMLERYPHEFSGGERQRIAIARALVLNPKLLILDEAVSSFDVIIQKQIIRLLIELQQSHKLTYLFISHNLKVVEKICHKVAVMYKGRIVETAATEELFKNPLHPYTKELLMAAVEYKTTERKGDIVIAPGARLIECGDGHFVLKG